MLKIREIRAGEAPNKDVVVFEDPLGVEVAAVFTVVREPDGRIIAAMPDPDVFWTGEATSSVHDTRLIVSAVAAFHRARHLLGDQAGQSEGQ